MLRIDPRARVLDFGCGFGHVAEMLSSRVEELFLWDASANMRSHARLKLDGQRNIKFLDLSDPKTPPHDLCFDLILVNSVVQYMTLDEFSTWLITVAQMLAPGGRDCCLRSNPARLSGYLGHSGSAEAERTPGLSGARHLASARRDMALPEHQAGTAPISYRTRRVERAGKGCWLGF